MRTSRGVIRRSLAGLAAASAAFAFTAATASADEGDGGFGDNDGIHATSGKFGGAAPLEDAHTVRHWSGKTTNPVDGVTYHYNMVGADPESDDSATIGVDIIPVNVIVGSAAFNGSDSAQPLLASPIFRKGDYSTTTAATTATGGKGPGGELSSGNSGVQLLDATMRAQFNKVGTGYHLRLAPEVRDPITINVPGGLGTTLTSPGGVTYADIDNDWFKGQVVSEVHTLHLSPSRLALFLTTNLVLFVDKIPMHCCVIGSHGADDLPAATTDAQGDEDGRQKIHTFMWSSWLTAGFFSPKSSWAKQDIHGLSHELVEWATNPFINNTVQPWRSPIAPSYGCSNLLETGDPVVGVGFSQGSNPFFQNKYSDGTYHPEDEVFLSWFMRTSPNTVSQPAQNTPTAGRYTFMGDLNPFSFFKHPPVTC